MSPCRVRQNIEFSENWFEMSIYCCGFAKGSYHGAAAVGNESTIVQFVSTYRIPAFTSYRNRKDKSINNQLKLKRVAFLYLARYASIPRAVKRIKIGALLCVNSDAVRPRVQTWARHKSRSENLEGSNLDLRFSRVRIRMWVWNSEWCSIRLRLFYEFV